MAKRFVQFKVGDGKSISLWYDWWHPDGVLYDIDGHRIVYDIYGFCFERSQVGVASC